MQSIEAIADGLIEAMPYVEAPWDRACGGIPDLAAILALR